jgi:hypothetical protein
MCYKMPEDDLQVEWSARQLQRMSTNNCKLQTEFSQLVSTVSDLSQCVQQLSEQARVTRRNVTHIRVTQNGTTVLQHGFPALDIRCSIEMNSRMVAGEADVVKSYSDKVQFYYARSLSCKHVRERNQSFQ